jgi:hypothetical protein
LLQQGEFADASTFVGFGEREREREREEKTEEGGTTWEEGERERVVATIERGDGGCGGLAAEMRAAVGLGEKWGGVGLEKIFSRVIKDSEREMSHLMCHH